MKESSQRLYLLLPLMFILIAFITLSACGSGYQAPATVSPTHTPTSSQNISINLIAQNMSFDKNTLTVPAGANVTLVFSNKEAIPHNVAIYKTQAVTEVIFRGDIVSSKTINYQFIAPTTPGNYFFRCDIHPTAMTGTFVVQ